MVTRSKIKKKGIRKLKEETVLVRKEGKGLRRLPRYGYHDTEKGLVKLDRETGDMYFISDKGKPRRIWKGHEAGKKIKTVW